MKIISQILIILIVATLIGGAMYAAVNAAGDMTQTRTRGEFDGQRPPPLNGEFRPEHDGGREGREGGGWIFLPFGMVKNIFVVGIIAAIYFNASKWWIKRKRQQAMAAN